MVEPLPSQRPVLEALPYRLETCALSDAPGTTRFVVEETNSRIASHLDVGAIEVPVDSLKAVLCRQPCRPNLLKVDVQGFELHVLRGAGDRLRDFEVVILEVSIIRIGPVPIFAEVLEFMAQRGFRLYDFLPMYYRPLDGALWQGDAFFVREDSRLVASLDWA